MHVFLCIGSLLSSQTRRRIMMLFIDSADITFVRHFSPVSTELFICLDAQECSRIPLATTWRAVRSGATSSDFASNAAGAVALALMGQPI